MTTPITSSAHPLTAVRRTGTVVLVTDGAPTISVLLGGVDTDPIDLPYLTSYIPVVNDTVLIMSVGGDHVVVGSIFALSGVGTAIASGTISITPSAANTSTSGAVSFPSGRFSAPPMVVCNGQSLSNVLFQVMVSNITTSGCLLWITSANTSTRPIDWIAVQSP